MHEVARTAEAAPSRSILGMTVHAATYAHASGLVLERARARSSRYVCVATVNNVMESWDSPGFRDVMNGADLITPDGMPLVWGLKRLGHPHASGVYGPDLTPVILEIAAAHGISVGFYGSTQEALDRLQAVLHQRFPALQVPYMYSPSFRPLTTEEDAEIVANINNSGARILLIGLNTPKQDFWMAQHRGRVQAVMEWFFRLVTEPRRLWKRYLKHNPRFVVLFACQLLGMKMESR